MKCKHTWVSWLGSRVKCYTQATFKRDDSGKTVAHVTPNGVHYSKPLIFGDRCFLHGQQEAGGKT